VPVASRRWNVIVRTKPDSGDVERRSFQPAKSSIAAGAARNCMPANEPLGSWLRFQPSSSPLTGDRR
jgi:hypothetical protein